MYGYGAMYGTGYRTRGVGKGKLTHSAQPQPWPQTATPHIGIGVRDVVARWAGGQESESCRQLTLSSVGCEGRKGTPPEPSRIPWILRRSVDLAFKVPAQQVEVEMFPARAIPLVVVVTFSGGNNAIIFAIP